MAGRRKGLEEKECCLEINAKKKLNQRDSGQSPCFAHCTFLVLSIQ